MMRCRQPLRFTPPLILFLPFMLDYAVYVAIAFHVVYIPLFCHFAHCYDARLHAPLHADATLSYADAYA